MSQPNPATGFPDHHYDLVLVLQQALEDALRYECFADDSEEAGDQELAEWFRELASSDREIAQKGKELLLARLA